MGRNMTCRGLRERMSFTSPEVVARRHSVARMLKACAASCICTRAVVTLDYGLSPCVWATDEALSPFTPSSAFDPVVVRQFASRNGRLCREE